LEETVVKYIVQIEIDPDIGSELEEDPELMQSFLGTWQALKPIGMYFSMTRRAATIIVDVPNEDGMFEAIHQTWEITRSYPEIWPVAEMAEFGSLLQRIAKA
jgi:hypothetical protein